MLEGCLIILELGKNITDLKVGVKKTVRDKEGLLTRCGKEPVIDDSLSI